MFLSMFLNVFFIEVKKTFFKMFFICKLMFLTSMGGLNVENRQFSLPHSCSG